MFRTKALILVLALGAALILAACGGAAQPTAAPPTAAPVQPTAAPAQPTAAPAQPTTAPAATQASGGGFQIPEVVQGKFNVAFIYIGPHDDGGYTQAHDIGRQFVDQNMPDVHTA
jgi:basic membrane lipoprotein Med (substrate-binding protein (PBP1-ABC) superfamily)